MRATTATVRSSSGRNTLRIESPVTRRLRIWSHATRQISSEVQQQRSFQFLAFKLPLPSQDSAGKHRYHEGGSSEDIEIPCCCQSRPFCPASREIESDSGDEERNRKMNQDDMLRMFRE